ncbi:MAG: dihydropteroate synthase, partial [Spirochaetes bacterium]|nr:dihydropteroate synthase [Spirochaetota bacterium]
MKIPELWGVVNLTPDSFYGGSRADSVNALARAEQMLAHGAHAIDIGAESTRPGAIAVSAAEQIERLTAFTHDFSRAFGKDALRRISIDTRDIRVMRHMIDCGVGVINDVSGGSIEIYRLIADTGVDYVLMHTQGTPQTMQIAPHYADVVTEVRSYLEVQT